MKRLPENSEEAQKTEEILTTDNTDNTDYKKGYKFFLSVPTCHAIVTTTADPSNSWSG